MLQKCCKVDEIWRIFYVKRAENYFSSAWTLKLSFIFSSSYMNSLGATSEEGMKAGVCR
jgi:hypothetical protein